MTCCPNCFNDTELKGFIFTSTTVGNCDTCGSTGVKLIDAKELEEMFKPVIDSFKTRAELGLPAGIGDMIDVRIQSVWNVFNIPDPAKVRELLVEIVSDIKPSTDPILNESVEIEALVRTPATAVLHQEKWERFANEIKTKNRYFLTEVIDLRLLKTLLDFLAKTYKPGKIFYRARLSEKSGFPLADMWQPPANKATAGRANPIGISYLYLSTEKETTLYETRASYLDYITIAEFRLTAPLNIISLRAVDEISPFIFGDQLGNYFTHQQYLETLERELARPVRRFDRELDYLPSQYLCEYVKHLGYDGIEYGSSLRTGGINLAVFDASKLQGRNVAVYEVNGMDLTYGPAV